MPIKCKECQGTGVVKFTKERGGPKCNGCAGFGHMTKHILRLRVGSILDHPSVYMGGPSLNSLKKADRIINYLINEGVDIL